MPQSYLFAVRLFSDCGQGRRQKPTSGGQRLGKCYWGYSSSSSFRLNASLNASKFATAKLMLSLAISINFCSGSSSHDVSVKGLQMCASALSFAACKKAMQVANSSGIGGLPECSYCLIVGIVLFSFSCGHCLSSLSLR